MALINLARRVFYVEHMLKLYSSVIVKRQRPLEPDSLIPHFKKFKKKRKERLLRTKLLDREVSLRVIYSLELRPWETGRAKRYSD